MTLGRRAFVIQIVALISDGSKKVGEVGAFRALLGKGCENCKSP
jgi:hypothetical protein